MRSQLGVVAKSAKDGYFSASCLEHGGNFGWESSPVVNGVRMRDAVSNWFFEKGNRTLQYTLDDCGDLPCTVISGRQRCPHLSPSPGPGPAPGPSPGPAPPCCSPACDALLAKDCVGLKGKGAQCGQCIHQHARDLRPVCGNDGRAVITHYCGSTEAVSAMTTEVWATGGGHHVCDLSAGARLSRFGV